MKATRVYSQNTSPITWEEASRWNPTSRCPGGVPTDVKVRNEFSPRKLSELAYAELATRHRPDSGFGLRVKTLLGSGWGRLPPLVQVTQCREQKDGRHAGQSASDKENAVGVNEAVRCAQAFDLSA